VLCGIWGDCRRCSVSLIYLFIYLFINIPKVVKVLLNNEFNVNARGTSGAPAISYACLRGHYEIVDLFLQMGANVYHNDRYYSPALHSGMFLFIFSFSFFISFCLIYFSVFYYFLNFILS